MFAYLQGVITFKDPAYVNLEINGVGYECRISLNTYSSIKDLDKVKLYTHLQVKEDAHILYGFISSEEKATFLHLIGLTGIGPNTALMILSSLTSEELKHAVNTDDVKKIQSIKGIGAKSAQRIILELKDKFQKEDTYSSSSNFEGKKDNANKDEALTALTALGFTKNSAESILEKIIKANGENFTTEELIKKALKTS